MKDVDLDNEVKAIKTLCGTREKPRTLLVQKGLNIDHFEDPRTRELFKCIQAMSKSLKEIPTYFALSTYPNLSADARELITGSDAVHKPAKNVGDAELFFENLEKVRKARICMKATKKVLTILDPEDGDPDDAVPVIEKALLELRNVRDDTTIRVGTDSNLMEHVDRSLNRTTPNVVPTGFRDFDVDAGGLPRGGLTTLAATSGGGKSCMGLQMAINGTNAGFSAAVVSLEMSAEQTTNRLLANISSTNHEAFHLAQANSMQKQRSRKMLDEWNAANDAAGRRLQIYHIPDTTMSSIALQLRAFDYDIIVIDYINLLNKEDTNSSNEAAQLGEIARQAKIQATQTNAAWIVLAQLNEDGQVKYSRAIKEHSDYMWSWNYGETERETHVIEIEQQKSRNSKGFEFCLKERFEYQRFENAGETHENRDLKGVRKAKSQKKHPTAKPMPGLDFDEDDDDE